jgi:electron transport complex protein RnfB
MIAVTAERVDALLPQTQCRQCGYTGCLPYAQAVSDGAAEINRCPPGGGETISALAALLHMPELPLNPECGEIRPRTLAFIDEAVCIGCTLCIQACPVDAIVGAAKQMHTVIADHCTGCELCVPPCPVDCISLPPHPVEGISPAFAALSRERYNKRLVRLERNQADRAQRRRAKNETPESPEQRKQRIVAAALAIAKTRGRNA